MAEWRRVSRHDDHRDGFEPWMLREPVEELPPVHPRHPGVEQDDAGKLFADQVLHRRLAVAGDANGMTFQREDLANRFPGIGIVFDDENASHRTSPPVRVEITRSKGARESDTGIPGRTGGPRVRFSLLYRGSAPADPAPFDRCDLHARDYRDYLVDRRDAALVGAAAGSAGTSYVE